MKNPTQLSLHQTLPIKQSRSRRWKEIAKHKYLYVLVAPTIIFYLIFTYIPIYGIVLAFKEFDYSKGILGSPWIGFQNFGMCFANPGFSVAFRNTILISFGRLLIEFPVPIILALLLNEISKGRLTRVIQTVFTFPHFISWVVISGIVVGIFSSQGLYNQILSVFGLGESICADEWPRLYGRIVPVEHMERGGVVGHSVFGCHCGDQSGTVRSGSCRRGQSIAANEGDYMAGREIDSGNSLDIGRRQIMNGGFDQIFNMYNPAVYKYTDILDTLVYSSAFQDATGFGFSTTVGLLKSIINCALLFAANYFIKTIAKEEGL